MATAAKHLEIPVQDQERIARLESHVEHIQSDVTDVKADVRKLSEKIDTEVRKLNEKIDALKDTVSNLTTQIEARFERMNGQIEVRFAKLNMSRALDKVWWLLSMASLLAVMARGFKWI